MNLVRCSKKKLSIMFEIIFRKIKFTSNRFGFNMQPFLKNFTHIFQQKRHYE